MNLKICSIIALICGAYHAASQSEINTIPTPVYDSVYAERLMHQANLYFLNNRIDSALTKVDSALVVASMIDNNPLIYDAYLLRGNFYERIPRKESNVVDNYRQAIALAPQMDRLDLAIDALDCLYHFHLKNHQFEQALNVANERSSMLYQWEKEQQEVAQQSIRDSISLIQHQLDESQNQIASLSQSTQKQLQERWIAVAVVGLLIVIILILGIRIVRIQRKKQSPAEVSSPKEELTVKEQIPVKNSETLRLEQELDKMRFLISEQMKDHQSMHKSINLGLGEMLGEAKNQLDKWAKEAGEQLAVDHYLHIQNQLAKATHEVRKLTGNITTVQGTLQERVESLCTSYMRAHLKIDIQCNVPNMTLNATEQTILLNVLDEILKNSDTHSQANQIDVVLKEVNEGLRMDVTDNGQGFEVNGSLMKGRGLRRIIAWMSYVQGELDILSTPKQGTKYSLLFYKNR